MNFEQRPYTFDRVIRIIFTVLSIVGVFYVLNLLKGALLPFVVAWLLAYLLNPIVLFFQNKMKIRSRILAIVTTLVSISLVLTVLGFVLLPTISSEISKTAEVVTSLASTEQDSHLSEQAWYETLLSKVDFKELGKLLNPEEWSKIVESTLTHTWSILSASVNQLLHIVGWFIVLLYLVFIMIDYDKIINGAKDLIPQRYREITLLILKDVEDGMNSYFRGQSLIALLVGILFSIGFVIIGLPLAIPLGLFIGLLNMVPYLQIIGFVPTVLLCFLGSSNGDQSFWALLGLSLLVFVVVQSIQDIIITPKIMGKVTGLNPAVILLSLSIWGTLMGVMGMIIALPLTSLLLAYYQKYILKQNPDDGAEVVQEDQKTEKDCNN